jgi:hypothetical protein
VTSHANTEKRWYVHDVFEEAMAPDWKLCSFYAYLSSSPNDTVLSRIPTVLLIPLRQPLHLFFG